MNVFPIISLSFLFASLIITTVSANRNTHDVEMHKVESAETREGKSCSDPLCVH